jgi:adenine-specific DNA-methyltransferase
VDLRHPYLTDQLIAYIGNKRSLLPFLHEAFFRLAGGRSRVSFLDPFAGSGSVSRLARLMGFAVQANDWEPYSFVLNSCHLCLSARRLSGLFAARGGIGAVLGELNSLPAPPEAERYISRHYAPRSTAAADWRTERLFYTTENALAIDAMRGRIEQMYPGSPADSDGFDEKAALLAPLLYEAATHTNTSGVFKACHRGFGGHGADALSRIMAPVVLEPPVVVDCPHPSQVACQDAAAFLASRPADICYLDPPYAIHQYGSNYFMLNHLALWDRPPVSEERGADGRLRAKAGIREDWVRTRSAFCSAATAVSAFRRVLAAADCRHVAVSYSGDGVLALEQLCDLLAETGGLEVLARGHVKYPGGKQSLGRRHRTVEMLLVVDRTTRASAASRRRAAESLDAARLAVLAARSFSPGRVRGAFASEGDVLLPGSRGPGQPRIPMRDLYRFDDPAAAAAALGSLPAAAREQAAARLAACALADGGEEIDVLVRILREGRDPARRRRLLREIARLLNGFAHRKYRQAFEENLSHLRALAAAEPAFAALAPDLERIAVRAQKRFGEK